MKAITLIQPYATAIAMGYKSIETRSWKTPYRGPLAIHAAKGFPRWAKEFASEELAVGRLTTPLPFSAVVCIVELTMCEPTDGIETMISGLERRYGDYSPGRWAWLLRLVEVFPEPIPVKGAQGLWEWNR